MTIPGSANPLLLKAPAGGGGGGYAIERSIRLNAPDSAYLSRTPGSAGNRKTWTWAGWVKRARVNNSDLECFFACVPSASDYVQLAFQPGTNNLGLYIANPSGVAQSFSLNVYRDLSAWYHIVVAFDSTQATITNRLKVYVNGIEIAYSTDARIYITQNTDFAVNSVYQHTISGIVPYSATRYFSGYLADIHFIDGQALDPTSFGEFDDNGIWQPIAYTGTYPGNSFHLPFSDNSTAAALGTDTSGAGNDWTVNNISVTDGFTASYDVVPTAPGDAFDGNINTYAYGPSATTITFSPPLTAIANRLDLHARTGWTWTAATNLGTVTVADTGVAWPSGGSYNGWYSYSNASLTTIYSISVSAGANWTISGVQIAGSPAVVGTQLLVQGVGSNDSLVDVPTNGTETDTGLGSEVRGNYATLNPLENTGLTIGNGNLDTSCSASAWYSVKGTIGASSGKWYYESTISSGSLYQMIGLFSTNSALPAPGSVGYFPYLASGWAYQTSGNLVNGNVFLSSGISAASAGDVVMVAYDIDAGKLWFGKNGTWFNSGDPEAGTNAAYTNLSGALSLAISMYSSQSNSLNTGARPFAYTAPSGFKAINTASLPAPVITKPSEYMDVKLYTGNGSTQTISGLDFSPDLVWAKVRNQTGHHSLYDIVRGATKRLASGTTSAEATFTASLTSFNSDGFSLGSNPAGDVNWSGWSYVAWCWDAGDSTVTNNDGSITSSVRANPSAGFSIVTYTSVSGSFTVGHGLNAPPAFIVNKDRNSANNWLVYHSALGGTKGLSINLTDLAYTDSGYWNNTDPTSSVFTAGSYHSYSGTAARVAYCFAPVEGYSAFGSYTGNGSAADGPFVFTNHRPRWILLKRTDTASNWTIIDTAREGYNVDNDPLYPNVNNAEGTTDLADILSNGFKLRSADASVNANAGTYIYVSFAEQPFSLARAR